MVRAFAICAVILVAKAVTAQPIPPGAEPSIAVEPAPVSACGEHDCPVGQARESEHKPVDNKTLLRQKLAEMNCLQSEIDALRAATGTPQQILIKLQILEVSRTKLRNLPIDFATITDGRITNEQANLLFDRKSASFDFNSFDDSIAVDQLIQWMTQNGVARVMSRPQILATSGRPASFKVGGEVPIPSATGSGQPFEVKHVGTAVDVLAMSQGESRVRLEMRARVSNLDNAGSAEHAGKQLPSISVREFDTAFEMDLGKTTVVSGFVQKRVDAAKSGSQLATSENELELLVLVTPEAARESVPAEGQNGEPYHTATSEASPAERSLRVSKPYPPR